MNRNGACIQCCRRFNHDKLTRLLILDNYTPSRPFSSDCMYSRMIQLFTRTGKIRHPIWFLFFFFPFFQVCCDRRRVIHLPHSTQTLLMRTSLKLRTPSAMADKKKPPKLGIFFPSKFLGDYPRAI